MNSYSDSEIKNTNVLETLKSIKNFEEAEFFLKKEIPEWIVYTIDNYSKDYPHFTKNWNTICKKVNVTPKKIILVDDIVFDDNHKIIRDVCEYITRQGYVVRRVREFFPCGNCGAAIPVEDVWKSMKDAKIENIPDKWSDSCKKC